MTNLKEKKQIENNLQNLSMSLESSFGLNNIFNKNNLLQNDNNQNNKGFNLLLNNNILLCNQNLNINKNNSQIIDSIHPFNLYDSHNSNSFKKMNSFDSFNSKAQINNSFIENEKEKENTDILEINVKISEKKTLVFKIRRYDDMFKTVKIFCEINKLDTKLIRIFIIYIIKALNSIYGIYNLSLKAEEISFLKDIKENFFSNENEKKGKKQINYINEEIEKNDKNESPL